MDGVENVNNNMAVDSTTSANQHAAQMYVDETVRTNLDKRNSATRDSGSIDIDVLKENDDHPS